MRVLRSYMYSRLRKQLQCSMNTNIAIFPHVLRILSMDYLSLEKIEASKHESLCQKNVLYKLIYDNDDETLLSHVKGLIDANDTIKPGQLTLLLQPLEWSKELTDAMELLRSLEQHPVLGQPEQAPLRRTVYHAILLVCLPHISSFTAYILDRSENKDACMRFIQSCLIKSEEEFFYGNSVNFSDFESWVNFIRSRYMCYL